MCDACEMMARSKAIHAKAMSPEGFICDGGACDLSNADVHRGLAKAGLAPGVMTHGVEMADVHDRVTRVESRVKAVPAAPVVRLVSPWAWSFLSKAESQRLWQAELQRILPRLRHGSEGEREIRTLEAMFALESKALDAR